MVEMLMSIPSLDVNVATRASRTALMWAAKLGKLEIAKMLLAHKNPSHSQTIDVKLQDEDGKTASMYAADAGHSEIADEISKKL